MKKSFNNRWYWIYRLPFGRVSKQKNFKVTVFDRYNPIYNLGNLKNSKYQNKIKFIFGDIRDYDPTNKVSKK